MVEQCGTARAEEREQRGHDRAGHLLGVTAVISPRSAVPELTRSRRASGAQPRGTTKARTSRQMPSTPIRVVTTCAARAGASEPAAGDQRERDHHGARAQGAHPVPDDGGLAAPADHSPTARA